MESFAQPDSSDRRVGGSLRINRRTRVRPSLHVPEWGDYTGGEVDLNLPIKEPHRSCIHRQQRTRPDIAAS
ncbi:hypothetical protein TYRP_021007 [Tyrophagus putrescentiae]|nr:hypothetical protein TYRP_021007 [Tyrophagus putrescentiae]